MTDIGRPRMSAKDHTFTLGIEEEFAIVDPETRELRSHIQEILEGGKILLKEQIKPEMHQSVVELGTEICQSIDRCARPCDRVAQQTRGTRRSQRTEDRFGRARIRFRIGAISSSPKGSATRKSSKDMQQLARANLIFGLHVHVGIARSRNAPSTS